MYQEKERKSEKGITLIALIITIIVLLILAGVSISMVVGENGILNRATDAKRKSDQATTKENIEMAVIGALTEESYYMDVSKESLERELAKSFDMSKINMIDNLDGTFTIEFMEENKTYLVSGKKVEEIDWEKSFENAKAPIEQTITPDNIIGIGTDGNPVNMDLWEYCYDEVTKGYMLNDEDVSQNQEYNPNGTINESNTVRNSGYKGNFTEKGEIEGFVPQYISVDKGENFKPVTSLYRTFNLLSDLKVQPNLPSTALNMRSCFERCVNLENVSLPNKVEDITWCYGTTGVKKVTEIPPTVKKMAGVFSGCKSLEYASFIIPDGVEDIRSLFNLCDKLREVNIEIPESVTNMWTSFYYCESLEKGPTVIPKNVSIMHQTFQGCKKLTGRMKIEASPTDYYNCFEGGLGEYVTNGDLLIIQEGENNREILEKVMNTASGYRMNIKGEWESN